MLSDHRSGNVQAVAQHSRLKERSFKQSFQDCGINIVQRPSFRPRLLFYRISADLKFVNLMFHGSASAGIINKARYKFMMNFNNVHLLKWKYLIIIRCPSSIRDKNRSTCRVSDVYSRSQEAPHRDWFFAICKHVRALCYPFAIIFSLVEHIYMV
jgi:hypothetical protein